MRKLTVIFVLFAIASFFVLSTGETRPPIPHFELAPNSCGCNLDPYAPEEPPEPE